MQRWNPPPLQDSVASFGLWMVGLSEVSENFYFHKGRPMIEVSVLDLDPQSQPPSNPCSAP